MAPRPQHPRLTEVLPRALALLALLVTPLLWGRPPRPLAADEQVVLFPTDALRDTRDGSWTVPIRGWIYEPEIDDRLRALATKALRQVLPLPTAEGRAIFEQRLRLFLVDNQGHKRLQVRVAGQLHEIGPSDSAGHFSALVTVRAEDAAAAARDGVLDIELADPTLGSSARTSARMLPTTGISVISDVDDTIKITEVIDTRALLRNTFARPFRAAPGMAALYRRWAEDGVAFHYVSSSPWQLFTPLTRFMQREGFPSATLSLKLFQLADSSIVDLFADPLETKPPAIARILEAHPQRRFCLVGDSGEKDPEVYGQVARTFPERIVHVFIRDVTSEPADGQRYRRAFAGVAPDRWTLFSDPSGLRACL